MKESYTPSELKRLKNVKIFPVAIKPGESYARALKRNQKRAIAYAANKAGGRVYTGHHRSTELVGDVARWNRGMHFVNRTGDYAVLW
jgi:hypothetical protein